MPLSLRARNDAWGDIYCLFTGKNVIYLARELYELDVSMKITALET